LVIALRGYSAFFDASMDAGKSEVSTVVAGFLSSVENWEQWEISWRLALAEYGVPYFHMKELLSGKKPFDAPKWKSTTYRATFISRLVQITHDHVIASIGSLTKQTVFDSQNQFFELDKRYNPYVLSARDCAVHAREFVREKLKSDLPIAFIYERGDKGWGMLTREMEASGLPSPIRKHARPDPAVDDPPMIQLQACDLLAWEIRRGKQDARIKRTLRQSLRALAQVKHRLWFESHEDDVARLIRLAGIRLRPAWAHLANAEGLQRWYLQKDDKRRTV
jgi:hypothetical protein